MKKMFILFLCFALALSLCACGPSASTDDPGVENSAAMPEEDGWFVTTRVVDGVAKEENLKCMTMEEEQVRQESTAQMMLQAMIEYLGYTAAEDAETPCSHDFHHGKSRFESYSAHDADSHFHCVVAVETCEQCKMVFSAWVESIEEESHEFPPYLDTDPHQGGADSLFYTQYPDGCYCGYPSAKG